MNIDLHDFDTPRGGNDKQLQRYQMRIGEGKKSVVVDPKNNFDSSYYQRQRDLQQKQRDILQTQLHNTEAQEEVLIKDILTQVKERRDQQQDDYSQSSQLFEKNQAPPPTFFMRKNQSNNSFDNISVDHPLGVAGSDYKNYQDNQVTYHSRQNSYRGGQQQSSLLKPRSHQASMDNHSNSIDYQSGQIDKHLQQSQQSSSLHAQIPSHTRSHTATLYSRTQNERYLPTIEEKQIGESSVISPLGMPVTTFQHTRAILDKYKHLAPPTSITQEDDNDHDACNKKRYRPLQLKGRDETYLEKLMNYKGEDLILHRIKVQEQNKKTKITNSSDESYHLKTLKKPKPEQNSPPTLPIVTPYKSPIRLVDMPRPKKRKGRITKRVAQEFTSSMPEEKLADIVSANLYNEARHRKQNNREEITKVIEEQNKLLSKMLNELQKEEVSSHQRSHSTSSNRHTHKSVREHLNNQNKSLDRDLNQFVSSLSNIHTQLKNEVALQQNTHHNSNLHILRPYHRGEISENEANTKQLQIFSKHVLLPLPFAAARYHSRYKVKQPPMLF